MCNGPAPVPAPSASGARAAAACAAARASPRARPHDVPHAALRVPAPRRLPGRRGGACPIETHVSLADDGSGLKYSVRRERWEEAAAPRRGGGGSPSLLRNSCQCRGRAVDASRMRRGEGRRAMLMAEMMAQGSHTHVYGAGRWGRRRRRHLVRRVDPRKVVVDPLS